MANDQKTEKATPKKRRDERKKGNVFVSKDVTNIVSILGMFLFLGLFSASFFENMSTLISKSLDHSLAMPELTMDHYPELWRDIIMDFFRAVTPILIASVVFAIIPVIAQTRMMFSSEALKPKFNRLNPISGIARMFSARSLVELLKGSVKITIIGYVIYIFLKRYSVNLARSLDMELVQSIQMILDLILKLVIRVSVFFIGIASFDYFYSWWEYEKQIRMSKEEIKEEYKQTEGDPQIKSRIKEQQRSMAMSRMMQQVPSADVIIRNPTHYAVALRYDIARDMAPIVVAKGQDHTALKIVEIGEKNNVYILEQRELARALYATTGLNEYIPEDFYGLVAEVLAIVYRTTGREIKS